MEDDQDDVIFSQEAMRQQDDLVFPQYNFGSEPPNQNEQLPGLLEATQQDIGAASECGWTRSVGLAPAVVAVAGPGTGRVDGGLRGERPRPRWRYAHGKIFSDPIHGTFRLDPVNVTIIDTPEFQRLRELHQLGLTHLVFPGAVHSRFEHSLGTSYKAFEVAERIYRTQGQELGMHKDDIWLASLAGLCHDLGHGPFSHVFEYEFLRRKLLGEVEGSDGYKEFKDWHHENMSIKILEHLIDANNIEGIERQHINRIADLIRGDVHEDQGFLFDIVNNKRCGVDVDKVDYLQRDALMCDVNIGCDFKRLLTLTKVIDNQICYKWSEYSNLWDLFHARESMHRKVYTHRKTKAVEFMAVDALLLADQALGFSQHIHRAEDFCKLNDSLLTTIENFDLLHGRLGAQLDNGADRCLRDAQAIIRRLRRRELYRFGNQVNVPRDVLKDGRWPSMSRRFTAAEVASCYSGGEVDLRPEHVIVSETKIDYTNGGGNPLDNVMFFKRTEDTEGYRIEPHRVVGILPEFHQERILRVYTPQLDPAYQAAVADALANWCRRHFGFAVQLATPARRRRDAAPSQGLTQTQTRTQSVSHMQREALMQEADPRRGPPARPPLAPGSAAGPTTSAVTASRANVTFANADIGRAVNEPSGSVGGDGGYRMYGNSGGGADNAAAVGGGAGGLHTMMHDVDADAQGTPTRSIAIANTPTRSVAAAGSQIAAAGAGGEGELGPAAAGSVGTAGRSKRARSSVQLFSDA